MAVNTDNFGFKKPDESDFYDVQDQNGNWDIADQELEKLNSPTFEDYTEDTSVPEAVTAIEALKSKSKIGMLLSNIKAAFKGACLIGHIVNNCVTDNPSLPLSAAQGKVLMDYYTKLYSDLAGLRFYITDVTGEIDENSTIVLRELPENDIIISAWAPDVHNYIILIPFKTFESYSWTISARWLDMTKLPVQTINVRLLIASK